MPLLVMLATHGTSSLLLRLIPVLAPELILNHGWTEELVGWVASAASIGSVALVLFGTGLLKALGSTRAIRLGLLAGMLGIVMLTRPVSWLVVVAGMLIGFAHAPANPAGNELLERYAPRGCRALIFSLKQSAPPLGNVLAGLALPWLAVNFGLNAALGFSALLVVGALIATQPLHRRHKVPFRGGVLRGSFSFGNLTTPIRVVSSSPALRRLAVIGFALSIVQSMWAVFLPSYLVLGRGYAVTTAGLLFAGVQAISIGGRVLLGWSADRLGSSSSMLVGALVASTLVTVALAISGYYRLDAVLLTVIACSGVATAGWNGVHVAEIIRLAGPRKVFETVSGMMLVIGLGVILGPLLFAAMLDIFGGWEAAFLASCLIPAMGLLIAFTMQSGENDIDEPSA
jgi:MFS family permease